MGLVDTHCHLDVPPLADDLPGVLARARERQVRRIVAPAYDLASWERVERIARDHRDVSPALGLHPWVADQALDPEELSRRLIASGAVAVGEIGLDFHIPSFDRSRQLEILRVQIAVARKLDLPVLLHCRGAFPEMLDLLAESRGGLRGVLHAFSRGPELAARFLDLGLYLAFGGAVTRPGAKRARRAACAVPPDRLLTETDAPSIGLHGVPPEEVEPRHVADVVQALAEIRGETEAEVGRRTAENAEALFRFGIAP